MSKERLTKALFLLEQVIDGRLPADVALEQWPDIDTEKDDLIPIVWHHLSHFSADEDIRNKDPEYAVYQKGLLLKQANKIREKLRDKF